MIDSQFGQAKLEYFIESQGNIIITQIDPIDKKYDSSEHIKIEQNKSLIPKTPFVNRPFDERGKVVFYSIIESNMYNHMSKLRTPFLY